MTPATPALSFDCARWQTMLAAQDVCDSRAWVGVLHRHAYAAGCGTMLVWRASGAGVEVALREYAGSAASDVAVLLVMDEPAVERILAAGLGRIPALMRSGALHPYMLMTLEGLQEVGLDEFVEDLGLVFPKH